MDILTLQSAGILAIGFAVGFAGRKAVPFLQKLVGMTPTPIDDAALALLQSFAASEVKKKEDSNVII